LRVDVEKFNPSITGDLNFNVLYSYKRIPSRII